MIYLASSSPRRLELMNKITSNFKIIKPTFDESLISKDSTHLALEESIGKAKSVQKLVESDSCIIACDTIVTYLDKVFLKPIDLKDAFNTLKFLSDKTHTVISGYTIIYKDKIISKEIKTDVTFNKLSDEEILNYINTSYVLDKAGSYAIQDNKKYCLIKSITGSLDNVIGFPVDEIKQDLIELKVI